MPNKVRSTTVGRVTELTLLTPIKQGFVPGTQPPIRYADAIRGVLAAVDKVPRPNGLDRIGTIHFARWVVIDDEQKLLFTSNFDGTWEQYLRDFNVLFANYLDMIWSNCVGYPGAANYYEFCDWVRAHQVETQLFFAAVPDITVKDVKYLKQLKTLFDGFQKSVQGLERSEWPDAIRKPYEDLEKALGALDLNML
jgi:hypothetical protein